MRLRLWIGCVAMATMAATLPAAAPGSHTAFEHVSQGATGGNAVLPTQFVGSSADGTRVFLRTEEKLATSDTDAAFDLYERAGGVTTHLSVSPIGGNMGVVPSLGGTSEDGRRVFIDTPEKLVPEDTDDCAPDVPEENPCADVYESSGGVMTLISTWPGGHGGFTARFAGASADGTRVFFTTNEQMAASDTDAEMDIYQRAGGSTTLLSTGTAGGNGSFQQSFRGASADGTRVYFTTFEQLTAQDTDTAPDVYERTGSTTTLLSSGPTGGNSGAGATFEGASRDGTRVFIGTTEQLTSTDTDSSSDIYERQGAATTLVSVGPAGGNGSDDASFKVVSEGGTRVLFESAEALVSSDTDGAVDVYERSAGATAILSTGPAGGNANVDALFQGASADGSRVVLRTSESLVAADTDGLGDLYERLGSTTSLVSTGPAGGNGAFESFFSTMSSDGRRVIFESLEPLGSDSDSLPDLYERFDGVTTKLSGGTGGANGDFIAVFLGASDDGSRVFFNSAEVLASTDGDTASDVYVARTTDTYVRPKGASPFSVPLVIAYRQCTAPNRVHGPPGLGGATINSSCNPPIQVSDHLTVGTFDANQRAVQSKGNVSFTVTPGNASTPADEADVLLHLELNDVRRRGTLDDYTGELKVSVGVRITDRENGSVAEDPATVATLPFEFVTSCTATADTETGSLCNTDTTADAVLPGAVAELFRANWELGRVEVYDGGSDGVASTPGNTLFAVQGVFIP